MVQVSVRTFWKLRGLEVVLLPLVFVGAAAVPVHLRDVHPRGLGVPVGSGKTLRVQRELCTLLDRSLLVALMGAVRVPLHVRQGQWLFGSHGVAHDFAHSDTVGPQLPRLRR